ncbi:hypothetical protein BGX30_004305 [Mortierella sp. GBA39]|nr:hypothetical protein BGX30_004305 [Mortierella sp. GBA39]
MRTDVEERDDCVQSYSRYHERGQRTGLRRKERDEENRAKEGIQDASSRQREATQIPTDRPLSRAGEEGRERKVSLGSLGEVSEPTAKILRSLSVDMELLYMDLPRMGRRANRSSVLLSREPGTVAGEGVDLRGQQLLPDGQERDQDESIQVADTAARFGAMAMATSSSNGPLTISDLSFGESTSADRDVAQRDPRRLPTGTNGASLILGQAGYYTTRDLEALFAHWEEKCLPSWEARDTNNLRPEIGKGFKGKGRKLDKSRDIRKRKDSRSSLYDESNSAGGFEEEGESDDDDDDDDDDDGDDDDDDDDEDETESDKDEVDGNKRGAEGASGSSKRKRRLSSRRVSKGRGKGKDSLESSGRKQKKLKSAEETKRHPYTP